MKSAYFANIAVAALCLLPSIGCYSGSPSSAPTNDPNNGNQANQKTLTLAVHDETELSPGAKIFVSAEVDSGATKLVLPNSTQFQCDGTTMNYDEASGLYKAAIPSHAIGDSYNFTMSDAAGSHFVATVSVRARPVITSPTSGTTVTRSKAFAIQYTPDPVSVGVASTVRTSSDVFVSSSPETDNGTSARYDITSAEPGGGWVQIIRHYQTLHTDLGYNSISANYYTGHVATVTFQ